MSGPESEKTPFQEVMESEERVPEVRARNREALKRAQESAKDSIMKYLKGEGGFPRADISDEERALLERAGSRVRKAMQENPNAAEVNLDFSKNPDAQRTWDNLINRMTRERLPEDIAGNWNPPEEERE